MATLIDKELFDYLAHLEDEVNKRISISNQGSLQHLMHSQMRGIIEAEKDFLKYINLNGTQSVLSISPNGLPSVDSLNPDLEKMCELAEDEISFSDVAQRFRKGMKGKNMGEDGYLYVPVSEGEWSKELTNISKEKLHSQIGFAINETDDGKFELALREDVYLQGYDKHSKEFPVLIREGRIRYHVVWNRLVEDTEESFYVPNTALVLQGKTTKPPKMQFDDINRFYEFSKKDYKSYNGRMPFLFWGSWVPNNYSDFLSAGSNARVNIANNILETLSEALERKVDLKGISKNDLEVTLAFPTIPFENAPQTTLKDDDLFELNKFGSIVQSRFPTKYNLIYTSGSEEIGTIEYFLPRNSVHFSEGYSGGFRDGYKFNLGGVKLNVLGSAIYNEDQFRKIQKGLKVI